MPFCYQLTVFFIWFCIFCVFTFLMRPLCPFVTNWPGTSLAKFFVNTIFIIKPLIVKAFWTVKLIVIIIYHKCFGTLIRSVGRFVLIYLRIWGFEIAYFEEHPCWPLSWCTPHFVNFVCLYLWILGILCILRSIPAGGVTCVWWRRGWWAPTCLSHPPSTQPDTSVSLTKEDIISRAKRKFGHPPSTQPDTSVSLTKEDTISRATRNFGHPPSTQPDISVSLQGGEKEQGAHHLPNLHLTKEQH